MTENQKTVIEIVKNCNCAKFKENVIDNCKNIVDHIIHMKEIYFM